MKNKLAYEIKEHRITKYFCVICFNFKTLSGIPYML